MINNIVLASSSPRRKEILKNLGLEYTICIPDCDEEINELLEPNEYVETLAKRKGLSVKQKLLKDGVDISNTLIISCDTIVYYDYGESIILGKPKDDREAALMLELLSDSYHTVYSGLCLINGKDEKMTFVSSESTRVKFRMLTDDIIEEYIKTGEPFGKAGAYGIQTMGGALVEGIEGDYFNIVGFPVTLFETMLSALYKTNIFELRNNIEKAKHDK